MREEDLREVHQIQVYLLKEFIQAAEALGLTYYLVGGSALGAVKFQGFVPWDDDIDVAMPRKDYDRFLEKGQALLPEEIFLQNYRTDPEFPLLFSKLRASNTTMIETSWKLMNINHGIYIDVFPLDGFPENAVSAFWTDLRLNACKAILAISRNRYREERGLRGRVERFGYRLIGRQLNTASFLDKMTRILRGNDLDKSRYAYNYGNKLHRRERVPRELYGEGRLGVFENLSVTLPAETDAFLRLRFGSYQEDIPEDKKQGSHQFCAVDPQKSYREYVGRV